MLFNFFYKKIIKPLLFCFDAEHVHETTLKIAHFFLKNKLTRKCIRHILNSAPASEESDLSVNLCGLTLPNPIGLAPGFDKQILLGRTVSTLGFGFTEVGTITPRPQPGNPKPRLFRVPEQTAILNRMGFNSDGMDVAFANLEILEKIKLVQKIPLGINIGKNKITENKDAILDYLELLKKFSAHADYFTINISSPNTPGLRDLQNIEFLESLLNSFDNLKIRQPVFVKLAPEVDESALKDLASLCKKNSDSKGFHGLVLTNTIATDKGGLSGLPLKEKSFAALVNARKYLPNTAAIISVGGIDSAQEVDRRLKAGAQAVQIYSALIYNGPGLIFKILKDLHKIRGRK